MNKITQDRVSVELKIWDGLESGEKAMVSCSANFRGLSNCQRVDSFDELAPPGAGFAQYHFITQKPSNIFDTHFTQEDKDQAMKLIRAWGKKQQMEIEKPSLLFLH